jgi:SNF2 family DNA or RNA helicase
MYLFTASATLQAVGKRKEKQKAKPKLAKNVAQRLEGYKPGQECSICLDVVVRSDAAVTQCGHIYCDGCIRGYLTSDPNALCPQCRQPIKADKLLAGVDVLPEDVSDEEEEEDEEEDAEAGENGAGAAGDRRKKGELTTAQQIRYLQKTILSGIEHFTSMPLSAKVKKAIELIKADLDENQHVKTLIFSQWTSMFDMLGPQLKAAKIVFNRYDGSLDRHQREEVLKEFRESDNCSVMLCR